MMLFRISLAVCLMFLLVACGGGGGSGGGGGGCNEALTVDYLQDQFATEFPGFTESNSTIVHTDGNQGNTYDIDVVAVSRTTYDSNNSLAFSYTIYGTAAPPTGTHIAFFIDTDKDMGTGMTVGNLGADALVVNAPGGLANGYYLRSGSSWVKQSTLGGYSSNAHYFQGCSYSTTIYAPLYTGLSSLYATDVTGIVMVVTIDGSDPGNITSILDATSEFSFTIP